MNIAKLSLKPCRKCQSFDAGWPDFCKNHWVETPPDRYNHFLVNGTWYVLPGKFTGALLALVEPTDAMYIQGALYRPEPHRIDTLTELLALLQKAGCTVEQLSTVFDPEQVTRMKGRVLNKLVKGR